MTALLVGLGGVCGVPARFGIGKATLHTDALIWSREGINVVGSFLLGLLAAEGDLRLRAGTQVGRLSPSSVCANMCSCAGTT